MTNERTVAPFFLSWAPWLIRLAKYKDRLASFADQGLQGVANIAVSILLGRILSKPDFASIGLMLGIYYFTIGLHRNIVVLPFILDGRHERTGQPTTEDHWWWFNLAFLIALGGALAGLAWGFSTFAPANMAWASRALTFSAAISPALLMAEFMRRWLYQARRPIAAAASSALYFLLNIGVAVGVYVTAAGLHWAAASWVVAGVGSAIFAMVLAPPHFGGWRNAWRVWRPHWHFSLWQTLSHVPYALYNSSVVLLISAFGGVAAAASYTVARTLTSPATSVVAAVDSLDKPRAVRAWTQRGIDGLRDSVHRTQRLLLVVNGVFLGLLFVAAPQILHLAFGDRYLSHATDVRILAVSFFLFCLNQPAETLLIVLRESRLMFAMRLTSAAATLVLLPLGSHLYGPTGCIGALLAVQVISLAELKLAERWAASKWSAPLAPEAAAS